MLTPQQRNIGATVGMKDEIVRIAGKLAVDDSPVTNITDEIEKLFNVESNSCQAKIQNQCTFEIESTMEPGDDTISTFRCSIDKCPLGEIVTEEIRGMDLETIKDNALRTQ